MTDAYPQATLSNPYELQGEQSIVDQPIKAVVVIDRHGEFDVSPQSELAAELAAIAREFPDGIPGGSE